MPKEVEAKIRASVKRAHPTYSKERVDREVYATMNKQGLLRKSSRYEREFERYDRPSLARKRISPAKATRGEREYSRNRVARTKKRKR